MQRIPIQENAKRKKPKIEKSQKHPNNKIARIWKSIEIEKDNNMSIESSTKTQSQTSSHSYMNLI